MTTGKIGLVVLAGLVLGAPAALAQEDPNDVGVRAEQAYYKGHYLEVGLRDFAAAIEAYKQAEGLAYTDPLRGLKVRSILGKGRCLTEMGRMDEAREAFEAALKIDPDNTEAGKFLEAWRTASQEDDELQSHIGGLVNRLGQAERDQAMKDLQLVGNRAVRQLSEALRSREVGIMEGAAKTLAKIGTKESHAALVAGFSDEDVAFPKVLVEALDEIKTPGRGGLDVFIAAMEGSDGALRGRVLALLGGKLGRNPFRSEVAPETLARILEMGLADSTPETKVATLRILQHAPADVVQGGNEVLSDETWVALLGSKEPGVSWNAMWALNRLRIDSPWPDTIRAAVVRAIEDILAGRRDSRQLFYYMNSLAKPETRKFETNDLIRLWSAAYESDRVGTLDRWNILVAVLNHLSKAHESDREALADVARQGWFRIPVVGHSLWLDHFLELKACPPDLLLEAADDPSSEVRGLAYMGIWHAWRELQGTDMAPALTHLTEDLLGDDEDVRQNLLNVLRGHEVPAAAPVLRKLRAEGRSSDSVLRALVKAVGEKALPEVREDLESDDWETARTLLVKLLGVEAVPELVAMAKRMENGSDLVLDDARRLLIPAEVARAYMAELPVELRDGPLVIATAPVLSPEARTALVIDALKSDDWDLQDAGAQVAARFHVEPAWPYLIPLLDGSPEVQAQAEAALEAIRSYRELKGSFERYGAGGPSKVLEDAMRLTKSDDPLKRRGGALALGALGDPAGISVLLGLLDDADDGVRQAALGALERLGGKPKPAGEK